MNTYRGNNIVGVRENNISLIIRLLHRSKSKTCSRAELAEKTGLKQATITYIINDLLERQIVCETGSIEGKMKRRSIGITLCADKYFIISIHITDDEIISGCFDIDGKIYHKYCYNVKSSQNISEIIDMITNAVYDMNNSNPEKNIIAVGIAVSDLTLFGNVDIGKIVMQKTGIPVFTECDANCGLLAEYWHGDVGGCSDIMYVWGKDEIITSMIIGGKLYKNKNTKNGNLTHMCINIDGEKCTCGNNGCLCLYCSPKKIVDNYINLRKKSDILDIKPQDVFLMASQGDHFAVEAVRRSAVYLGAALASAVNIMRPQLLIIGGIYSNGSSAVLEPISEEFTKRLPADYLAKLKIRLSTCFPDDAILFGAAALVIENIIVHPTKYLKTK